MAGPQSVTKNLSYDQVKFSATNLSFSKFFDMAWQYFTVHENKHILGQHPIIRLLLCPCWKDVLRENALKAKKISLSASTV